MKTNANIKVLSIMGIIVVIGVLIRMNVTATKEEPSGGQNLNLEISSEIVQTLYNKLTILEDDLKSDNYKYPYFRMNGENSKDLTPEEKFYIAVENMYHEGRFDIKKSANGIEKVRVSEEEMVDEVKELFKDEEFNPRNLNYLTALKCGLVNYLYTGSEYEFTINACKDEYEVAKNKLVGAIKEGNYVKLKIKSFLAVKSFSKNKKEILGYVLKNYNGDEIAVVSSEELDADEIYDKYDFDSYIFSFELIGDDYRLMNIAIES